MAVTGFFNKAIAKQDNTFIEPSFINVGGELFHAIAVGLIDDFKNTSRHHEPSIKKILEYFYRYFPKLIANQAYLTPAERMSMLIKSGRNSEIVECMAFVLRQIAVDEILAHPLNYREVFSHFSPETEKRDLTHSSTMLPIGAIKALHNVLALNMTLSHREHGKELRRRERLEHENNSLPASAFQVVLQVQGNYYFPQVKSKADYAYVGQLAISPKPHVDENRLLGNLLPTLNEITQADKQLLSDYEQKRRILSSMIDAGELSVKQLIDLYIEFLPVKPHVTSVDPLYVRQLEGLDKTPVEYNPSNQSQHYVAQQLVNGLASWISSKQVDEDMVFDRIESKSSSPSRV